ncbi:hypothetical protein QEN19_004287 [Hanseniaspora menglaensis]
MNFLKSVFNSSSEFSNLAGEAPPYNVVDSVSKGDEEIEIYDCNYKSSNLKELEYICLHNGIDAKKVNDNLILSMIRKKPDEIQRMDQYGNSAISKSDSNVDFVQSANNFISLFHNESVNFNNNVMVHILKIYDRFDSFVTENVELLNKSGDIGANKPYLDYTILKLFRMILKNNYTFSHKDLKLDEILFIFIERDSMNIKLYVEGLCQSSQAGNEKAVFKLLKQRYPNINNINDLNFHLNNLVQKNDFIKIIEFINRINDTSLMELTQLTNSLSQRASEISSFLENLEGKMWQIGVIDKIISRYNSLKKQQLDSKEPDSDFDIFENSFFKMLSTLVEYDHKSLSKYNFIFLDYIKNNPEGKQNIINILLALNICYSNKFDINSSNQSNFPLLLFNCLQPMIRNNKINSEENLNISRLFLLLLKSSQFNSQLTDKFICNDVLRLVSEISKLSGSIEAQNFSDIKSLNYLIVVLIVSLKDTILSFYGSDRGYTILISAILQNSNIQKSKSSLKTNSNLSYDLAILQTLKNEISNWPTELIVTKLLPVQSLISLLLISSEKEDKDLELEVAEANKNIAQSAFDIYLHIISRVANEGGFTLEDKSKPMFSKINKSIAEITDVEYYKRIMAINDYEHFSSKNIPTIVQYTDSISSDFNDATIKTVDNNFYKNWSSWSDEDDNDEKEIELKISNTSSAFRNIRVSEKQKSSKVAEQKIGQSSRSILPATKDAPKKTVLRSDTRRIPAIKKKTPVTKEKTKATSSSAFPSFASDNEEDGWGDEW